MRSPAFLLLLAAAGLAGCEDVKPPPGEVIGTFTFEGALDPGATGACDFPESPGTLRFDAVLSYEPEPLADGSQKFWLQILGQAADLREGRLYGTRFFVRSPPEPDRVPRSLEACRFDENGDNVPDRTRCTLGVAELAGGDLRARLPDDGGCTAEDVAACDEAAATHGTPACTLPAPVANAEGKKVLEPVGAVCGDVTEDVLPEAAETPCLCTGTDATVRVASPCTIVYRLVGTPS